MKIDRLSRIYWCFQESLAYISISCYGPRLMVRRAKKITILVDHTKIFNPGLMTICEMAAVTNLVTDRNPPERFVELKKESGTNLVVAKAE